MKSLFTLAALLVLALPLYSMNETSAENDSPPPGPKTVIMADSLALVDIYNSTVGASWTNKTNWLTGNVNTWYGIAVNSTTKRVTEIQLQSNHLVGSLPASVGNLTALQVFRFASNSITGELPYSVGNLTSLLYLYVNNNQMTGEIPASIANLKQLINAYFYSNNFTGGLSWVGFNPVMQALDLDSNPNFEGTIPSTIGNLTVLNYLAIYNTKISGGIPSSIGNCTALSKLYIHSTQLSGTLPASMSNLVNLTAFYCHATLLEGEVQPGMNNWTKMGVLSIGGNAISGTLPNLGGLTLMTEFYFQNCGIRGGPPSSLTAATNLAVLDMKFLELTTIPSFISGFTKLKTLTVNNNQLDAILNLTSHVNKANLVYNVENNKLDFGDLEPNFTGAGTTPYKTFTYSPQADVGTPETRYWTAGASSSIAVTTPGTYNTYQWQKKDGSGVWQSVSGQTTATLTIASPVLGDAGEYRLKINNTRATALSLYTASFTVIVTGSTLPPDAANMEICSGLTAGLSATGTGNIHWYDAASGGTELATTASYTTPALTANTTYYVSQEISSIMSDRRPVVVTVKPIPTVTANADVSICTGGSATVSVSGNANAWSWDHSLGSGTAYSVSPSTTTTYNITGTGTNGCTATDAVDVIVVAMPVAAISPSSPTVCPGSSVQLNASGGSSYSWDDGVLSSSRTVKPASTTSYTVTVYNSLGCSDTESVTVTVDGVCPSSPDNVRAVPVTATTGTVYWVNNATNQTGFKVERKTGSGGTFALVGTTSGTASEFADSNLSPFTEYYYRVKAYNGTGESPPSSEARAKTFSQDQNYVEEIRVLIDNVTVSADVDNLDIGERLIRLTYLDGESNTVQTVTQEYSPSQKDFVQPADHDDLGRVAKQYLPYTITSSSPGEYRPAALTTEQPAFYHETTAPDNVPVENDNPFTETKYEPSPLSRVVESSNVGADWKMSTGHTDKMAYGTNDDTEVLHWTISGTPSLVATYYYAAGELSKVTQTNAQGLKIVTYTDKAGNVVLTKRSANPTSSTWLYSYSVYDNLGQLSYMITPKAFATLGSTLPLTINSTLINSLCYQYTYDERGRLIEQKEPNIDPVYFVYDQWDRIVLTQNARQRPDNKWSFTKYDETNRIILSGIVVNSSSVASIRTAYAGYTVRFESRSDAGGNVFGYTNSAYPISPDKVFYACYYDDYSFLTSQITGTKYQYNSGALTGLPSNNSTRQAVGRKTGSRTLLIDDSEDTYLNGVSYLDEDGNTIQVITDNHKGGTDRVSNRYNFVASLTKSKLEHFQGDLVKQHVVTKEFEYDHVGRLTKSWHQLDGANKVLLSEISYNELGMLVREQFYKDGSEALQALDYDFTIQGWYKGLNLSSSVGSDASDYFTQELAFHDDFGSGNTERLDGFITANRWKNDISSNNQAYNYEYDAVGRLTAAHYKKDAGAGWTAHPDAYTERGITYDQNGNIQSMQRQTKEDGGSVIDDLSYTYASNTNKLLSVTDNPGNTLVAQGFKDGNTSGDDYDYDAVGNLTKDLNKGITSITYNSINLPQTVTLADATITYVYDANGVKLSQTYDPGTPVVYDYMGEFIYVNDILRMVETAKGRILPSDFKNLIANCEANSLSGFEAIGTGAVDLDLYNGVSDNYVKATASTTTANIGVFPIGGTFSVKAGEHYLFKLQGYQAVGTSATLYIWGNTGDIVATGPALPVGSGNEAIVSKDFEVPTGVTSVKVGVRWSSPSVNDALYINRVALYKTDWEYQFFLQDYQGNNRVVLQTTPGTSTYISTMETENLSYEHFDLIDTDYILPFTAANHTEGGDEVLKMDDVNRLAATRSIQVFPGDEIDVSVYSYYEHTSGHSQGENTIIAGLLTTALSGGSIVTSGEAITGAYDNTDELLFGLAPDVDSDKPAAFLNYILFNEDYIPVEGKSVPVDDDPSLSQISMNIQVKEMGYLYVYLSYEDETSLGVYFDDLEIKYKESPVVQVNMYYPFGSAAYSWIRSGEIENRFQWQGKELDPNSGWYDFSARQYDGSIGRFISLDPQKQFPSGYTGMGNNPVMGVDPDGEFFWFAPLIFGVANVVGDAIRGDIHKGKDLGKDLLRSFARGAAQGALVALTGGAAFAAEGAGWLALAQATSSQLPGITVPIGNTGSSLTISPSVIFGSHKFGVGVNASLRVQAGNFSLSYGVGTNYSTGLGPEGTAFNSIASVTAAYDDKNWGISYGLNNYFSGETSQATGIVRARVRDFHAALDNDILALSGDKYRTGGLEFGWRDYAVGLAVFTGNPDDPEYKGDGVDKAHAVKRPVDPDRGGKFGLYTGEPEGKKYRNGLLYASYRGSRIGIDSENVRAWAQNGLHDNLTHNPHFEKIPRATKVYYEYFRGIRFGLY